MLKVGVFDSKSGAVLGQAARRLEVCVTPDGGREQRLGSIDRMFAAIVEELRNHVGSAWSGVGGVALAAQGGSNIIADRATGKAKTPMVLWNDGRSGPGLARIATLRTKRFWRGFCVVRRSTERFWGVCGGSSNCILNWSRTHSSTLVPGSTSFTA